MGRLGRARYKANKAITAVGLFVIAFIGIFAIAYMAMGIVTANASNVYTVYAYNAAGTQVDVSNIDKEGDTLRFTPNSSVAYIKIEMKDEWKDMKGMFTAVYVNLKGIDEANIWELAKVYLSDGTTDLYIGSISEDDGEATLDVDPDDVKSMDDFKPVLVIIKFYDANGNLVDALAAGEQEVGLKFTVPIRTDTITAFASSLVLAFIVAIRRFVAAVTSCFSSFLLAITTNSAVLTILGAIVVVVAWWYLSEHGVFRARR